MTRLSEHFHLSEFTRSQEAARRGIDNSAPAWAVRNMALLCEHVLEPTRAHFGQPIVLSSGWRAPALNSAIKGSKDSQHCKGEAADFEIHGISNLEVARWMQRNLAFDQLILEFHVPGDPNSGWIHASYREPCRKEALTAVKKRVLGRLKTVYLPGLVA